MPPSLPQDAADARSLPTQPDGPGAQPAAPGAEALVWCDGALVPAGVAGVPLDDRGLLLADGLFETLRARAGRIEDLGPHLDRLARGALVLGLALPDRALLETALVETHAAQGRADGALRLTVTRGSGPRGLIAPPGLRPRVLVTFAPAGPTPGPARVVSVPIPRGSGTPTAAIKSLAYLDQVLARQAAAALGADEALMRNAHWRVACASAANVFVRVDDRWITPPVADGALPGIMRARVLAAGLAIEAQVPVWAPIRAMVLTSSLIGVRAVADLDGRTLEPPPSALLALGTP